MDDTKLREAFKWASEIAAVVPESMHDAAFNRALDAIMGSTEPRASDESGSVRAAPRSSSAKAPQAAASDPIETLTALDRGKAEEVDGEQGGMGKALALLHVARRELDIDGLTSPQIASILTEKFRFRITRLGK